ncbi:MAG: Pycsar system effector family protein [Pseudonocardiaceae bacterium]
MTCRRESTTPGGNSPVVPPDPDQAWKALSLVNDWVKHAEAKLGVILAATGVSGGVLFNLVKDRGHPSWLFDVVATVCGVAVLVAGGCAMIGLYPVVRFRRKSVDDAVNPLFFHDVAGAYKGDAPSYSSVLHTLTTNREDLVRHLGQQIHANATIAQRKYRWANRAIRALLVDLLALAAVATMIALKK